MAKSNKKSSSAISNTFCQALGRVLAEKTKGLQGDAVSMSKICKALKPREFGISNLQLFRMLAGQAISEGSVPGYATVRGPGGGAYNVADRDAWNAKVETETEAA